MDDVIRLGISSCLLGNQPGCDGDCRPDRFLTDTLGQFVEFVPVCPAAEAGLPVGRQRFKLVGEPGDPRLVSVEAGEDWTDRMHRWTTEKLDALLSEELDGFIFKSGSPICAMEKVKVFGEPGGTSRKGVGIFARAFIDRFPHLPVEDDERLHDPQTRENFISRIFVHRRWRTLTAITRSRGGLVDFHTSHKLVILSHSEKEYREMGRLVAGARDLAVATLYTRYGEMLAAALRKPATVKKHTNVLSHIFGYFKNFLSPAEKEEILEVLEQYHQGLVPLLVPVTLLNHLAKRFRQEYLVNQHYLDPHPLQLRLLNHA